MEKRNRVEAINGEHELPEAIIQYIQSFLSRREAAQTSILSKSWYGAWSTRPNPDFDQRDFERPLLDQNTIEFLESVKKIDVNERDIEFHPISENREGFWDFVKKTMQRYEELKLKIASFRLCAFQSLLTNELLVKAMKIGATDLSLDLRTDKTWKFVLPHEVLESKTLIRLSVERCRIDQRVDGKISCSKLKSLRLRRVHFEGDVFRNIILSCPLIEELSLSACMYLFKLQNSSVVTTSIKSLELSSINQHEFRKLKYLVLEHVVIDNLFFSDFSSRFPCLKELSVQFCYGYNEMRISSRSLECISLAQKAGGIWRVDFDVSSIRKFDFWGSDLPSLSFKTASREWASDISIKCHQACTSWFLKLKKFLKELSPSIISLTLDIWTIDKSSNDYTRDIKDLPKPIVENLMVHPPSSVNSALLEGLFCSCRPKFITHYWLPGGNKNNDFLENLCKRLVQAVSENCSISNQSMSGLHDLEEVNVELFEEGLAKWRPLPWKTLLDAAESPKNNRKIRFELRWGQDPITFKC